MKINTQQFKKMFLLLAAGIIMFSCSTESTEATDTNDDAALEITTKDLTLSDEVDLVDEEISNIALDVLAADEAEASGRNDYVSDYLPDCVTITTIVTSTSRTKIIDFGDGCELPNGNVLAGIITISYTNDMEASTKTLSVTLENFFFNAISIEGSKTIVRSLPEGGNPIATKTVNLFALWPDGESISYSANKTREWIEGFGTGFWGDNVFLLTGNATFVNLAGVEFSKNITTPLRREWACRFIVSGVLEVSRDTHTISLDFGDGSCDPFGVVTWPDGSTHEVRLRRFLHG